MWRIHAHTLSTLTKLCSTKVKFKWTDVEKNSFMAMTKILRRDIILSNPYFIEDFIIHIDDKKCLSWD